MNEEETKKVITSATELDKTLTTDNLQCGYLVGLSKEKDGKDGQFIFQLLGEERGLLQLQGLHGYASNHIQKLTDEALKVGNGFIVDILSQVTQALVEKLDKVSAEVKELRESLSKPDKQ